MASVVKAKYDYDSGHEDDLSFFAGQIINIIGEEGEEWYNGEYVGSDGNRRQGMFPRNFVTTMPPKVEATRIVEHREKETATVSSLLESTHFQTPGVQASAQTINTPSDRRAISPPASTFDKGDTRNPFGQAQTPEQSVKSNKFLLDQLT
jgi:hypothetical protein